MSLPHGFLDELRTRLSLSQVVGRKVMWDNRKSQPGKGDMWSPCPFHQEKTASFHVDDKKGFYYCFGCHAKGDAITFVRETENVSFMEAVEILAGEAGMQMPARDPRAQEKADRRTILADVMEQAVKFFDLQLKRGDGSAARDYLIGRGLDADAQNRWDIGFAPDAWQGLWDHLRGQNVAEDLILAAGLAKPSQKGGRPYDTFRNRIMFPIRDVRGRAIAFGGRAMDPDDNAKYLNSPETELFDKSRVLFNHQRARDAVGKGKPLIVAEGYMDVISLSEHGFTGAVAPLGTAVTEHQLALLWRMAPVPVIMLDGDKAGQRAMHRLIDLALPHIGPDRSLQFVVLPDGMDPDDYLKKHGAKHLEHRIEEATALIDALWERELKFGPVDTPEQRAGLDKRLHDILAKIQDQSVRQYYDRALKDKKWQAFSTRRPDQWQQRRTTRGVTSGAKQSLLGAGDQMVRFELIREKVILAGLLSRYKDLFHLFRDGLDDLIFSEDTHRKIADCLASLDRDLEDAEVRQALEKSRVLSSVDDIFRNEFVRINPVTNRRKSLDDVRTLIEADIALLHADRCHRQEMEESAEDILEWSGEDITYRILYANRSLHQAERGSSEDSVEFVRAKNGLDVDIHERDAFHALLNNLNLKD